jgi:NADPH:quinone reductase-like Zn-dependent oxidoreductase
MHAIQLARLAGAYVVAQTTSPDKAAMIREAGAHAVVVTERGADFSGDVKKASEGRGVDVVIDNVGSPLFEPTRRSLGTGGRWLLIGQLTGQFVPFNPAQLFLKNISMLSATSTTRKQLEDALAMVARGQIKPVISRMLPLEAAAQAHQAVEAGAALGRIVLQPNG